MDRAATMNKPGRVSIAVAIIAMTAAVSTCPHVDGTPALNRSQRSSIENAPSSPSLSHPLLKSQAAKACTVQYVSLFLTLIKWWKMIFNPYLAVLVFYLHVFLEVLKYLHSFDGIKIIVYAMAKGPRMSGIVLNRVSRYIQEAQAN